MSYRTSCVFSTQTYFLKSHLELAFAHVNQHLRFCVFVTL